MSANLFGGLEIELTMGWVRDKINKHKGKVAIAMAAATFASGAPDTGIKAAANYINPQNEIHLGEAEAINYKFKDLPPMFQITKDESLRNIFAMMYFNRHPDANLMDMKKSLLGEHTHYITGCIKPETPLVDPAYWLAVFYFNRYSTDSNIYISTSDLKHIEKKVKTQKPAMWEFQEGLAKYFKIWLNGGRDDPRIIEEDFAKSFVLACGRPESEYSALIERIEIQTNDSYIQGLMSTLKNRSPEDQLLAGSTIFMLTLNSYKTTKNKNAKYNFMRYKIEEPLINKGVTPRIRGKPHYGI